MSSIIATVETDVKSVVNTVSTDLKSEVARLETLLEKAKTTITSQAATIAGHVQAAVASNTEVATATSTLKAKLDDFEAVLAKAVTPVAAVASTVILTDAKGNTTANVVWSGAQTVTVNAPVAPVAVAPTANAVVTALDAALHAGSATPTLKNLNELEAAFAKLMANAGTSNSAAVPMPAHVAAIVTSAQTATDGVLHRIEGDVVASATEVKTEAEKVVSEVEVGVKNVAEGNVTIGPLHI